MTKQERTQAANELLQVISSCGRKFFRHDDRVGMLEVDARGHVWFVDAYRGTRVHTHYRYEWRGFSEGDTLRGLIINLVVFICLGTPIPKSALGPWPDWICGGDPWGYGDDMEQVRDAAKRLGILTEASQ